MHKDQITEALKNYRSYRYAVNQYERHRPFPQAGVANYTGMSGGEGAPELFFTQNARMADMGRTGFQDRLDYQAYKDFIDEVDGALNTLSDEEQSVIKLKWMEGLTLKTISDRKSYSVETIKRTHTRALNKLAVCFRFMSGPPPIENLDHVHKGSQHFHHAERDTFLTSRTNLF
jgi:DNA-directed RNA polymerase specialized sigma subunit, sigma24 homolog